MPWTRLLVAGPSRGPDGEAIRDLVRTGAAEPARYAIKKSWNYGGRSVFLGADHDEGAARRASEVMETAPGSSLAWQDLVNAALLFGRLGAAPVGLPALRFLAQRLAPGRGSQDHRGSQPHPRLAW